MKVRITKKVHSYQVGAIRYGPGDIVEVDDSHFNPSFMEIVAAGIPEVSTPLTKEEKEEKVEDDKFGKAAMRRATR